ncbi:MAG: hydrogenase iron-sulfur subunit [Thermodesulfobacteriota bacterium]
MPNQTPSIIAFCCQNALSAEKELLGRGRLSFEPEIRIVTLPCSSKVDSLAIIKAFEAGAQGVFVLGCTGESCRMIDGNSRAARIVAYTRKILSETGIDPGRLAMFSLEMDGFQDFAQAARAMAKQIGNLEDPAAEAA